NLIQIGEEDFPVCGRLHGHGGDDAAGAHRAQDGEDFPVTLRRAFMHSCPTRGASIQPRHARGDAAFIEENQLLRRDGAEPRDELFAAPTIFFRISPIRFSARAIWARLIVSPRSWSSFSRNCSSVRSGTASSQRRNCSRGSSNSLRGVPRCCSTRSI